MTINFTVAPFAGAWIETTDSRDLTCTAVKSLPSRERGLKLKLCFFKRHIVESLPSRERGLKPAIPS